MLFSLIMLFQTAFGNMPSTIQIISETYLITDMIRYLMLKMIIYMEQNILPKDVYHEFHYTSSPIQEV